ncbi:MAG: type IV toxin-antitoxin system AbiEi family antitoxin domain-containing protein [Spirochaetes bacterium]|nr:type IV toxin-antitoxin system AbiEi family antitoxin domain-containing protein [Spirochaetota bacterium]
MIKNLLLESDKTIFFFDYLKTQGYSAQLLYQYVKSGWLEKIVKGVYKIRGKKIEPIQIINALQNQLNKKLYISAQSALLLHKKTHYLKFNNLYFVFYSDFRLNKWLNSLAYFKFIKCDLFNNDKIGFTTVENGLKISSIERAFIEMAFLIPLHASYEEMLKTMELAPNLRASLLQELLESCNSIKAKRLFLHISETVKHNWFKKLDISKISLGSGTRQLVKDGIYIKKYDIYVPRI